MDRLAVEYYYEMVNLCRLVDPQMLEAPKLGNLFDELRPTLVERIWMTQPKTFEEFLMAARLLSEAADAVDQESLAVDLLAEEKESSYKRWQQEWKGKGKRNRRHYSS